MIEKIYLLRHSYEQQNDGFVFLQVKGLGIFASKEEAESAIEYFKTLQGFKNYPEGFQNTEYKVDEHHIKDDIVLPDGVTNIKGYMDDSENAEGADDYPVFLLQHYIEYNDKDGIYCEETRNLGIYSTWDKGMQAKAHYKSMKGFNSLPDDCFYLEGRVLNRKGWTEGFVTVDDDDPAGE